MTINAVEHGMITVSNRPGLGLDLVPDIFDRKDALHKITKL